MKIKTVELLTEESDKMHWVPKSITTFHWRVVYSVLSWSWMCCEKCVDMSNTEISLE